MKQKSVVISLSLLLMVLVGMVGCTCEYELELVRQGILQDVEWGIYSDTLGNDYMCTIKFDDGYRCSFPDYAGRQLRYCDSKGGLVSYYRVGETYYLYATYETQSLKDCGCVAFYLLSLTEIKSSTFNMCRGR